LIFGLWLVSHYTFFSGVMLLAIPKKTLDLLELFHNIKFTDEQVGFLDIVFSKRTRKRWPLHYFEWAVHLAITLFPDPGQHPEFVRPPLFEQLKLESLDDSIS